MPRTPILRTATTAAALVALMFAAGCGGEPEQDLLASARSYAEKQDHKAAIIQLKAALQKNPNSGEARFLLGQELFRTGDMRAAVTELGKAVDLKYDDNRVLPLLAKAIMGTGEAAKITALYGDVTLTDPKAAADLKSTVAAAYGVQGQIERSEAAARAALQLDPKNPVARLLEARLTAGRGDIDKALSLVDALLADEPGKREALHLRGDLLWVGKGDVDGAIKAYRDALASDARYGPAHASLMTLLLGKRDLEGFRAQVAELARQQPNSPDTRFYQAQLALLDRNIPKARELVLQLLKVAPENARVLQLAGAIESAGGSLLVAETHLAKVLQLDPTQRNARRLLAEVYVRGGQSSRALATLDPLLERDPPSAVLALAAEAHLQLGNPARAEALFKQAEQTDPDDPKIRTALALTQIAKGNADGGFAQLEAVAAKDTTAYADLALISALLRRNDAAGALKAIDRLQAKQPDKPLPHQLRASVLGQRKDFAGARASYEKALAIDAGFFPAIAGLARLDLQDQKPQDALKRFEDLLARDPGNASALVAVAEMKQRTGAPKEEVAGLLAQAVRASPQEVGPRLLLIDHHIATGDTKLAVTVAQQAVATLRDDPRATQALGQAQLANGDVQQAISTFGRLATSQPRTAGPQLLLAEAHMKNKDKASAEASLRKALEIAPNLPAAMSGLWQIAMTDKRYDQALQVARQVQQAYPKDAGGLLLEADVHGAQRAYEPAIKATRAALERQRTTAIAMKLHALLSLAGQGADADRFAADWLRASPKDAVFVAHLGAMALDRNDYARAETRYREVLALAPDNVTALNNLAWVMARQKKPGAVALAEKALGLAPERAAVMDTLAVALAADNQVAKAVEWQRKAVAKEPGTPDYRLHLAELLLQAGDKAGAKSELEALQKLGEKYASGQKRVDELLRTL